MLLEKSTALLLTSTAARPAIGCEGEEQLSICVLTKMASTTVVPNRHLSSTELTKPSPSMLTSVRPRHIPTAGEMACTATVSVYWNCKAATLNSVPPSMLTLSRVARLASASCGGDSHCSLCAEMKVALTGISPKRQSSCPGSSTSPSPMTVTSVPPEEGPLAGEALSRPTSAS